MNNVEPAALGRVLKNFMISDFVIESAFEWRNHRIPTDKAKQKSFGSGLPALEKARGNLLLRSGG